MRVALYKFRFTVAVSTKRHHAMLRIDGMTVSGSADLTVASDDQGELSLTPLIWTQFGVRPKRSPYAVVVSSC